jgi:hypothetical protein
VVNEQLLGREIDVERAFGDAGDARDLVHAGRVETIGEKHPPRAVENLARLLVAAAVTIARPGART